MAESFCGWRAGVETGKYIALEGYAHRFILQKFITSIQSPLRRSHNGLRLGFIIVPLGILTGLRGVILARNMRSVCLHAGIRSVRRLGCGG